MTSSSSSTHGEWIPQVAAVVELLDDSHGVLGELIHPEIVLQGLRLRDNVGRMDDPHAALATQAMHSFTTSSSATNSPEVPIEFDNATSHIITVRWMDEQGHAFHNGTIDPFSQMVRYSKCGHLFVLAVYHDRGDEFLLGAYRIRMPCASGSPHQMLIEEVPSIENIFETKTSSEFKLEVLIADPTGHDELIIAAAALDTTVAGGTEAAAITKTIKALHTVVSNLLHHPDDPKYQSLKASNPKVQSTLLRNYAAKQILYCIGFRENKQEDHWNYKPNDNVHASSERLVQAMELLETLLARSQHGFVAELAPPPVWQGPILNSSYMNANTRGFGSVGATHFLTDDEKWARAERNRMRRGRGGGRRPDPGHAPSSNGPWGR